MYKIYADHTLIYDSTLEDYHIGKGEVTLEVDKSGSFVFSVYPDHFYYDSFVELRTVVVVYKDDRIVFRGRVLNVSTDYWNNKVLTCEGELGFLQDSIVRPYGFSGTPAALFKKFIDGHNAQVDEFKRFKLGTVTVTGAGYIADNEGYESTLDNLTSRLLEEAPGGHLYITHGDDGRDEVPTIHYLADFTKVATQGIEFGVNLKNYAKTINAEDVATAIIPLGAPVDDGDDDTKDKPLTITKVNGGVDYVYSSAGVALRGWIFKTVTWEEVTDADILLAKAREYVEQVINLSIMVELTAIDLHFLDRSIESYGVCEYIPVSSAPHNFQAVLLCNKQTMNLLKPDNDTVVLGAAYLTLTSNNIKTYTHQIKKLVSTVSGASTSVRVATTVAQQASADVSALSERVTVLEQGGTGTSFETDETLTLQDGVLSVNRAFSVEADNTLPVTSAAVHVEVGNIDALLKTI